MVNLDRFKFRWFDKNLCFMAQVKYLNIDDDYALVRYSYVDEYTPDEEINISDGILMQSTGLRDKKGKLIYEGDILRVISYDFYIEPWLTTVYCSENVLCIDVKDCCDLDCNAIGFHKHCEYTIVGNIYEHKHLLDK